ncbi:MAG: LPS-assembly protein LptD [Rhodospirillales bacterium]|nr:LPS-assembly protein LptD [Rhodospirillales bacterium]
MATPSNPFKIGGALAARLCALALLASGLVAGTPAWAQRAPDTGIPALLRADEIVVDDDLGLVTAQGNVEISQADRLLKTDTLTYNRRTNTVTATGNVSLLEPSGEVLFAEFVELTDDMREGAMRNLRLIIADQSRFAAVTARRADGSKTVMRRATYSPCEPCRDDPTRAPAWQIRASRITHDQEKKEVVYDDARLEIAGVPVLYTPYFSHPDGTEKRKSGFLLPELSTSSRVGGMVTTPYYWVISPTSDATISPSIIFNDNPMLSGEYRQRFNAGQAQFSGSVLNTNREGEGFPRVRGHIGGDGRFDIDDTWRWGFEAMRASDKTYIDRYRLRQRFNFLQQNTLESRLYTEGFNDRGYAVVDFMAFQGLRPEDDPGLTPFVLPAARYRWEGEQGAAGGRFTFDGDAVVVHRSRGTESRHASMVNGWTLPYTTRSGEIYTLTASVQTDAFDVQQLGPTSDQFRPTENGTNVRAMPQVAMSWRYPLVRRHGLVSTIIEPMAAVYVAPNMGAQRNLPNEDSRGLTFDDTNLFRMNRFSGRDRLESGQRFVYGLNTELMRSSSQRVSVFLGQQYRSTTEPAAAGGSGIDTRFSDLIGRTIFIPATWMRVTHGFQMDNATREIQRSISTAAFGGSALTYSVSHVRIDRALQPSAVNSINQIAHSLNSRIDENWSVRGRVSEALNAAEKGILVAGATLIYEDDCLIWGLDLTRRNIGRAEIPPDTALLFRFGFRNLGEFRFAGL